MTTAVAQIWRHPIKSHGREEISEVSLTEGQAMPWDRRWAVAHERSCFDVDRPRWQPCQEFSIGSKSPRLQAITAQIDPTYHKITLSHPDRVDLTIDPDDQGDANRFIQWVMPISNGARTLPSRLVRAKQAMTDTDYPSISLINLASHRAVEAQLGHEITPLRWRGNLLIDGWEAWAEREMIGRKLRIGTAELEIRDHIGRCKATTANPQTGAVDVDTLAALRNGFGHRDLGVYAVVTVSGDVRQGDQAVVI
ncbi:MAG: MOSC domain-containing protein [Rhodobacterales bacterium]